MSAKTKIEAISALAELERMGVAVVPASDNEVRIKCPFHDDEEPSLSLNIVKNVFICQASGCKQKGDIISLLARIMSVERQVMIVDLSSRYDLEEVKVINPATAEKFHQDIWSSGPLLQALRDRGVTDAMIRQARLGYYSGRITIPVYDQHGNIVNIRRYLPGAPGPEKMKNSKGYGDPRIYQIDQLAKFETIWLCGGEMKALVTGTLLNEFDVGAICVTAGEGAFDTRWLPMFKGKKVFICMDVDNAGRAASARLGGILFRSAADVKIIELPLNKEQFPKGDVNDYVGRCGATAADLLACQKTARPYVPAQAKAVAADLTSVRRVSLARTTDPQNIAKRIAFTACPVAMDEIPFLIPKNVTVNCDRAQPQCGFCPIAGMDLDPDGGGTKVTIPAVASGLLEMVGAPSSRTEEGVRMALEIPKCKSVGFVITEHYEIRDVRLAPQLNIGGESSGNVVQPAFVVGVKTELNTPYEMSGVVHPHPKTQQAVLLVDTASEADDNISTFAPTAEDLESLQIFRPKDWSLASLRAKLIEIYDDIEANVTNVYGRKEIHLALDLTYHSALVLKFDGKVTPGWVNSLILGDSSQGKSETALRLIEHYGLGMRTELKSATPAGLIGGLQQLGNRWFVSWGIIPTHDRRLVVLEEVKGTSIETIGKMTDMRSSGIAEIPKIERRRAHARTRLAWISNARSGRTMASYNFGVEAIKELIGGLEDIRRFDLAVIVAASQVDPNLVNKLKIERPVVQHRFTAELCRRSVLFAWTRTPDQVKFDDDAVRQVLDEAIRLCDRFTETMPLCDRGTMRFKLARLATALAVRTFSTADGDIQVVRVRKSHVEFIAQFLDKQYSAKEFGYLDFSKSQVQSSAVVEPDTVKAQISGTKHPRDLVRQLLVRDDVTIPDFQDWCELDVEEARGLLSFFVRKHCLFRSKYAYQKSGDFITLLKAMEAEGVPEKAQVIAGEEF